MSIIPLRFGVPEPSVVDTTERFQEAGGIDGQAVLIRQLQLKQLAAESGNSNASYDLRVGNEYRDHRDVGKRDLQEGAVLKILPGMAVIIESLEEFHLPRAVFGVVVPKVDLAQLGLTTTASKVDPGYAGHLLITAYNLGKKTIELRRGDNLCSIYFSQGLPGGRIYDKQAKKLPGAMTQGAWPAFRYWIEANTATWTVILLILTALSLGWNIALSILPRRSSPMPAAVVTSPGTRR